LTELPDTAGSRRLDALVRKLGGAISWLWLVLIGVIVANVVMRYAFGTGRVEFEELQWHLYALGFLCGLSYCVESDAHVRVDVLRERLSPRMRAWIELYGILLLLLPFNALVVIFGLPFAWESWQSGEISASPGGLPYRWFIKAALPLAFALLTLASCSRLLRVCGLLFAPIPGPERP